VVDVRVRQKQEIDVLGIESRFLPIQLPEFLESLKQARVDQKTTRVGFDQMSRTGDGAGAAVERQS
jgi:hypothetical protein